MTGDVRKALIRRLYEEAWSRGDLAVIEELFASNYVGPMPNVPPGPEGERRHVAMIRGVFPDLQVALEELVAEGDLVAARSTMTGTDTGGFMGREPTGQRVTFWGIDFFHFAGDRITSGWAGVDMLGLMIQLGILPSPWPAAEPEPTHRA
jgi:predicted ester cyclase